MTEAAKKYMEFRFYFTGKEFLSHFAELEKVEQYRAHVERTMRDRETLKIPTDNLTNQPERFINTHHVIFYALIEIEIPPAKPIEEIKNEDYQKIEDKEEHKTVYIDDILESQEYVGDPERIKHIGKYNPPTSGDSVGKRADKNKRAKSPRPAE